MCSEAAVVALDQGLRSVDTRLEPNRSQLGLSGGWKSQAFRIRPFASNGDALFDIVTGEIEAHVTSFGGLDTGQGPANASTIARNARNVCKITAPLNRH